MAGEEIVQKENKILRKVAKEVAIEDIGSRKVKTIIRRMVKALDSQEDGVAIAAPQIGENLRIFVISKKLFKMMSEEKIKNKENSEKEYEDMVFINPEIIKTSKEKMLTEEGCLSIRWLYGKVKRPQKTLVRAYDENGKPFTMGGSGLLSQAFQHEIDHLNGILFTDKATNLREMKPENKNEQKIIMKLVFFGGSQFSVYVLDELKACSILPELIITTSDKPKGRKLALTPTPVKIWAQENKIEVIDPKSLKKDNADLVSKLKINDYGLFLVASYGKIIPQEILDIPPKGTLNVHPSLLPKLRGASPIKSAILQENETGVSIMLLDAEMDHGPILTEEKIISWENNNPPYERGLAEMLGRKGGQILAQIIPKWLEGKIKVKKQNHDQATFCGKIEKEDGEINLGDSPEKNLRKIRAYHQWPVAFCFFERNGKKIRVNVKSARIEDKKLILEKVIPEGKKEMSFADFMRGQR